MKRTSYGWAFVFTLLISFFARAQSQPDSSLQKDKPQFKLGVYYNTNLNYYGRTDSLGSSGVFPLVEFWVNKNFYINAAPVFVNNEVSRLEYAGTVAIAGYQFRDKKWAGNTYIVKPIYKSNSQLVQSALKAQLASTVTRLNKVINVTFGGDVKFSDKIDYGATAGLDHIFRFEPGKDIVIVVDPSAYINAGTQQFTKSYYKKSSFLLFPEELQQVTESVQRFNILSYELSIPVVLATGKFQFILNPSYVLPQNLVIVPGRPDLSERGKDLFYATIGAKIIF